MRNPEAVRRSELQTIPGVGPSIAADLEDLKIRKVSDLRGRDPQTMYDALCAKRGHQDRCLLYVFRCAVYFAQTRRPDPEKLKWWSWSDARLASTRRTRRVVS
jgi:hypothetical protein